MANKVKDLYKAKSVEDLRNLAKTDFCLNDNISPLCLCKIADKLFEQGLKYQSDGDEEMAYVSFMRYMEVFKRIQGSNEFKEDRNFYIKQLGDTKPCEVLGTLEKISDSLMKRYDALQQSEQVAEKEQIEENLKLNEIELPAEVVEKTNDPKPTSGQSLGSVELYDLLGDNTQLLLIDVRPQRDFMESHLKSSSCINIPADVLAPGMTAADVERMLSPETVGAWSKRYLVDFVVLIDWNSNFETMTVGSSIHCLMEALTKLDQWTVLKSNPLVLKGGYEDWLLNFPSYTTNSNVTLPSRPEQNEIELLSNISYPDLDDEVINPPPGNITDSDSNSNIIFPANQQKPTFDLSVEPVTNVQPMHSYRIDSLSEKTAQKPNVTDPTKAVNRRVFGPFPIVEKQISEESKAVPTIDRTIKPMNKMEISLAEKSLEVLEERLEQEKQFEELRLRREREAEEGMREELQREEDRMRAKIESLERKQVESEQELKQVRKENQSMKTEIENFNRLKEEEEFHQQKMKSMDQKKKELDLEVDRMRQIRKEKEWSAANKSTVLPPVVQDTEPAGKAYTEPLKDAPLKRTSNLSLSSPDIMRQLEEEGEIPPITLKRKPDVRFDPSVQLKPIFELQRNFNPVFSSQGLSETGLRNLGNTCFMNSIIQCLYNTVPLTGYLLNEYRQHINRENKHGNSGEIAIELAVVIQTLYKGLYRSIAPTDFKATVGKYIPICGGSAQQDAHEFLVVLLDKLHADLNQGGFVQQPPGPTNDKTFWHWHVQQNSSIVTQLFEGLLQSTLRCLSCNARSHNYEVFSILSLPVSVNKCSLKECIMKFLETERMCDEALWDCPQCKQKREAEKCLTICRLPIILIIHLKRFSYEGGWRQKLQTCVDFPLNDLDMDQYLKSESKERLNYSLYGVVNHYGTLEGGHYTAYCKRSGDKWFHYDDHEVSEISACSVQTSAAYLLFYTSASFD